MLKGIPSESDPGTGAPAKPEPRSIWFRLTAPLRRSLSRKLLVLTLLFVMLSEVLIFVPSIANFRVTWLDERLSRAQIATLALEATPDDMLMPELEAELLENAQSYAVVLHRNSTRRLFLTEDMPPRVEAHFDLRDGSPAIYVMDAFSTLLQSGNRVIRVIGTPRFNAGEIIEVVIDEAPLRAAMLSYSANILSLSLVISILTAGLVFFTLNALLVSPLLRITENLVTFRKRPEDARSLIEPSARLDEVGLAEQELHAMQHQIRATLNQKARLAALGTAVSKINHDLRNILASAQLISDRIGSSDDPTVQTLAPRLFASIDRAIDLCTRTLQYGRAEEEEPHPRQLALRPLIDEVAHASGAADHESIQFVNDVPEGFEVFADPDHLFRILLNLVRNALQAMAESGATGAITVDAVLEDGRTDIFVTDQGPGISAPAQEHLFEAFVGSTRKEGSGLGLAIASELLRAHGGHIMLERTGPEGTCFCICLPASAHPASRAGSGVTVSGRVGGR